MRWWLIAVSAVVAVAVSGCDDTRSEMPASPPPPTSSSSQSGMADVHEVRAGGTAQLVDARLAGHDGFDRLVFEFADRVPGYTVGYQPLPAHADGSGAEIPLPGATALVQVTLTPASGWDEDARTYVGPSTLSADTATVTEVKAAGDFEAVLNWAAGLRAKVPFTVDVLDGPPRLVIDFQR